MKYGYNDQNLDTIIKKYKKTDDKIIITFLDGHKETANIDEEEHILNKMLEQATKKNNNSDLEEMIKNQKMFLKFTIHNIFLELTSLSIPYITDADIASKISLFLTGVFSVFLVEEAAFFKLSRNKISELKKYAIYLEKKKEIDEYMSSDIETFNINKLDNYSLEDLRLIKKELESNELKPSSRKCLLEKVKK